MATVSDILAKKGTRVFCVSPNATVLEAVALMTKHRIGSLVVTSADFAEAWTSCERVVGMFTERDVLTRIVGEARPASTTRVEDVMTTNVAFCRLDSTLEDVGAAMRERRIRHLPVCDLHGGLEGLISIGDLNAFHADGQANEITLLNEYIHGRA